jgi:competence protein ComEC
VLRVDSAHGSALLTGDIEAITEMRLVGRAAAELHVDVLLVPHHGSRTSSIPAFVRAVAPTFAVVTNGYRNRFGHPRAEVVARYRAVGAQVLRTDLDGAIVFTFAAGGAVVPVASRREAMRYWHDRPDARASPLD